MYSKLFLALFALFFTLTLVSAVDLNADIAYVVKDISGIDSQLQSELGNLGYSHEVIYESQVLATDFSKYRLILIGDQKLNTPALIPINEHKTLILTSKGYEELGISGSSGIKSSPTALEKTSVLSSITDLVPKFFNSYTSSSPTISTSYLKGNKPDNIKIIVSARSRPADAVLATLDAGQVLLDNRVLQQRILYLGIVDTNFWTQESRTLFENSINWLVNGEDLDQDTYFSDLDCNDLDPTIHPGAVDIAYDGIDQDCSGTDFADLDLDGYDSDIVGGLDCNDLDSNINPDNPNPLLNCINDAPSLNSPQDIDASEGSLVEVEIEAFDPESDSLTYTVEAPFIQDPEQENKFTWQTSFSDSGSHTITATVSDSEFTVGKSFIVTLSDKNQPPISEEIPEIRWNEDDSFSIDLLDYFSDPDGDELVFGVESSSSGTDIQLELLEGSSSVFVFTSSPDWHGSDWIIFHALDGFDKTLSNQVDLIVEPVNDLLSQIEMIENQTWPEDSVLEINLSLYFSDIDSIPSYNIVGLNSITSTIEGNILTLTPDKDFSGSEEMNLTVSDETSSISQNQILLTVTEQGEPPEFVLPLTCELILTEDEEYICLLEATDFELDPFTFSVSEQDNLLCTIEDNELTYRSAQDYNGLASCTLLVSDDHGTSSHKLEVTIEPVNDAPRINSQVPLSNTASVAIGYPQTFSVEASDPDSEFTISWLLDGIPVSEEESYNFSEDLGQYELLVNLSDDELNTENTWNVIVGPLSDFTCSELEANICEEDELCSGTPLDTKDSSSLSGVCCATTCVPKFEDVNACDVLNEDIELEITSPDSSDNIEVGDSINIDLEITNHHDSEQDYDVEIHLYNLDSDESLDSDSTSSTLDPEESESLDLELEISEDLDLDDNYALLVTAEDKICNQHFIDLDIDRPEDNVQITKLDIPTSAQCGDIIKAQIKIENLGSDDQSGTLRIQNNDLSLRESVDFEVDEFGDSSDNERKEILFSIPGNAEPGKYEIKATAVYSGRTSSLVEDLKVDCSNLEESVVEIERPAESILLLNKESTEARLVLGTSEQSKSISIVPYLILEIYILAMVALIFIFLSATRRKMKSKTLESKFKSLK